MFNDYDEKGYRTTRLGHRSSRTQDIAIVTNLRYAWKLLVVPLSNVELVNLYDEFAASDDFGNNDEKFGKWVTDYIAERDQRQCL